jgi:ferredoxin
MAVQPNPRSTTGAADSRPRRRSRGPIQVKVIVDRCVGCLACADACRPGALRLMPGTWAVGADAGRCNGCRLCVRACPFGLIAILPAGPAAPRRHPGASARGHEPSSVSRDQASSSPGCGR